MVAVRDISFVTTTYNDALFLPRLIRSIANSTDRPHKCVIVNDGSDQKKSNAIFSELRAVGPHQTIELVETHNLGLASARNLGIDRTNSKYIRFIDADDYLAAGSTDLLIRTIEKSESDVAIGNYNLWNEGSNKIEWPARNNSDISNLQWRDLTVMWELLYTIPIHSALFRNIDIRFPDGFKSKEDWVLWSQVSKLGRLEVTPQSVCTYILHENNMTKARDIRTCIHWIHAFLYINENVRIFKKSEREKMLVHFLKTYWDRIDQTVFLSLIKQSASMNRDEKFLVSVLEEFGLI